MLFRIATAPKALAWTPAVFWASSACEFEMAIEGLQGRFSSKPIVSREEIRRMAAAHGERKSIRNDPNAVPFSERTS